MKQPAPNRDHATPGDGPMQDRDVACMAALPVPGMTQRSVPLRRIDQQHRPPLAPNRADQQMGRQAAWQDGCSRAALRYADVSSISLRSVRSGRPSTRTSASVITTALSRKHPVSAVR